jgi:hypothetical protein
VGTRKGGVRMLMVIYFVFIYENRRMKPVEIILRKWGSGKRKNDE